MPEQDDTFSGSYKDSRGNIHASENDAKIADNNYLNPGSAAGGNWGGMSGLGGMIAWTIVSAVKITIFLIKYGILQCLAIGVGLAFTAGIIYTIITGIPLINNLVLYILAASVGFLIPFIMWRLKIWGVVVLTAVIGIIGYSYLFLGYNGIINSGVDVPGQNVIARTSTDTQLQSGRDRIAVKSGELVNIRGVISERLIPVNWKSSLRAKTRRGAIQADHLNITEIGDNTMAIITDATVTVSANLLFNMPLFNRDIQKLARGDTVRVISSHNTRFQYTKIEVGGKTGWIETNSFLIEGDPNIAISRTAEGIQTSGSYNDFAYEVNSTGNGIILSGYLGSNTGGKKVIPDEIYGLPVVRISGPMFHENFLSLSALESLMLNLFGRRLKTVTIPETVTSIENFIIDCEQLKQITLPSKLTRIGNNAFTGSGLTSIIIPATVTEIGSRAFANCVNLKTVTILGSRITIADDAFFGCSKLSEESKQAIRNAGFTGEFAGAATNQAVQTNRQQPQASDATEQQLAQARTTRDTIILRTPGATSGSNEVKRGRTVLLTGNVQSVIPQSLPGKSPNDTPVEYTEIKYGDITGWVRSEYLRK